jgi:hypothetical protein
MGKMNVDPIITFGDGSQLLVSTQHSGEGRFTCELYMSNPGASGPDGSGLRAVSGGLEAATCLQAQDIACTQAKRLFPSTALTIKAPPYLVWSGPRMPVEPDNRWRRSSQR